MATSNEGFLYVHMSVTDTDGLICIKTSMMVHFLRTLGSRITADVDIRYNAVCIVLVKVQSFLTLHLPYLHYSHITSTPAHF